MEDIHPGILEDGDPQWAVFAVYIVEYVRACMRENPNVYHEVSDVEFTANNVYDQFFAEINEEIPNYINGEAQTPRNTISEIFTKELLDRGFIVDTGACDAHNAWVFQLGPQIHTLLEHLDRRDGWKSNAEREVAALIQQTGRGVTNDDTLDNQLKVRDDQTRPYSYDIGVDGAFIECNGEQHYHAVERFHRRRNPAYHKGLNPQAPKWLTEQSVLNESLREQQLHDYCKREVCRYCCIRLLILRYDLPTAERNARVLNFLNMNDEEYAAYEREFMLEDHRKGRPAYTPLTWGEHVDYYDRIGKPLPEWHGSAHVTIKMRLGCDIHDDKGVLVDTDPETRIRTINASHGLPQRFKHCGQYYTIEWQSVSFKILEEDFVSLSEDVLPKGWLD
jgi:hypothetical protein